MAIPLGRTPHNGPLGRTPHNGLSHVAGDTTQPLLDLTIPGLLASVARKHPDHIAVVFPAQNIRWSYARLVREVDTVAQGLCARGLRKNDRVGIWSPNRIEWVLLQFATARIGAILVCINPAYRLSELEFALNKVECRMLVMANRFKNSDYVGMIRSLIPEIEQSGPGTWRSERLPHLRDIVVMEATDEPGVTFFDGLRAPPNLKELKDLDEKTAALSPQDPINIQFTSGTTGSPKGACLTHHNIVNNANFVTSTMAFSHTDRLCVPVPFYHCFGMVMGTLGCVTKGATLVVPGEGFDPHATLSAISDEKCTALYGVPTMFVSALELPEFSSFELGSLRTGIMAGAPCPAEIMRKVQSQMNMREVTIAYGMTETSPVSFQSNTDDPLEQRVTSVGRVHPHVEVKIVDNDGKTVPVGMQGELLTRGYSVMQGYWNDVEQTQDSIDDEGWMHTGDLATLDAHGYCKITGRVKDMILRGGENIYPREVEEFLYTHPDVLQAQVFGVPDARLGEIVCAWIVKRSGSTLSERDVREFCRDQVAYFKIPEHVRFRDNLPMTVTGKPQKFVMRDLMLNELNTPANAQGNPT